MPSSSLQEKASTEKLRDEALEDKAAAAQCSSETVSGVAELVSTLKAELESSGSKNVAQAKSAQSAISAANKILQN